MTRQALIAVGFAALVLPGLSAGQEQSYPYGDPNGGYGAQPPPPGEGAYGEVPPGEAAPQPPDVDVSVDLATPGATVSFETFHDSLQPYGDWVFAGSYGRVWRPRVAVGWRPYYYGHWEWTDEGWLWASDEPWGWAAYHYGRWAYDPTYSWIWVPGYQWAPAWVSWRFSGEVIGWAPLLPGFSVYVTSYPHIYSYWTFVPCGRFVGVPVYSAAYAPAYVPRIWHTTSPAPPRTVHYGVPAPAWGGPARTFVEQRVGRPIPAARIVPVASPTAIPSASRAGAVAVYRPEVRPAPARPPAFAPGRPAAPGTAVAPSRPHAGAFAPPSPSAAPPRGWAGSAPPQAFGNRAAPAAPQGGYRTAPPRYETAPARPQGGYAPVRPQGGGFSPPRAAPAAPRGGNGGGGRGGGGAGRGGGGGGGHSSGPAHFR